MKKCDVISSLETITDNNQSILIYLNMSSVLRVLGRRKTFSDSTYNFMKHNINELKHFIDCEECQNSFKKCINDIYEYTNQYVTDEMSDVNSHMNKNIRCVNNNISK